jgi:hypothetical protein
MSNGSAAKAGTHGLKSSALSVIIEKSSPTEVCSNMETVLRIKAPWIIDFDMIVRPKNMEAIISFKNPEDAQKAKAILKTCQFDTSDEKKTYKRKPKVEAIRPEKVTVVVGPELRDYDKVGEILAIHPSEIPALLKYERPTWLREEVISFPGLFDVCGTRLAIKQENVWKTRPARCYSKSFSGTIIFRVAHPEHPDIVDKCVDMCSNKGRTFEYGWKSIGEVEVPETILQCPDLWKYNL